MDRDSSPDLGDLDQAPGDGSQHQSLSQVVTPLILDKLRSLSTHVSTRGLSLKHLAVYSK